MSSRARNILEWIICIVVAFILALLIKYFIGTPTVVKQVSMKPTLVENQRLLLNRLVRTTKQMPERGDIITFEAPSNTKIPMQEDVDFTSPIAKYENEPTSWWGKFIYYVLEIGKESYIKRVIGLPGEHVEIKDGKVYINGEELQEDYLAEGVETGPRSNTSIYYSDFIVPENCIFAMGDNRKDSADCREFGCIPVEKIESKVWIRFWPFNLFGKVQ